MNDVAIPESDILGGLAGLPEQGKHALVDQISLNGLTPWIKVVNDNSKLSRENKEWVGKILLFTGNDNKYSLGDKFVCIPLVHRYKALDFREKEVKTNLDPDSQEFKDLIEYVDNAPSMEAEAIYGVEFLVLMLENEKWRFVTVYLSNPTLRGITDKMIQQEKQISVLKANRIAGKKERVWYGLEIQPSTQTQLPKVPGNVVTIANKWLLPPEKDEAAPEGAALAGDLGR